MHLYLLTLFLSHICRISFSSLAPVSQSDNNNTATSPFTSSMRIKVRPFSLSYTHTHTHTHTLTQSHSLSQSFPLSLSSGKVVYVSMGTLYHQDPKFFTFCFEEFRDSPYFVVISVGSGTDIASLGEIPPNVLVRGFVPQLDVLQRVRISLSLSLSLSLPSTPSLSLLPFLRPFSFLPFSLPSVLPLPQDNMLVPLTHISQTEVFISHGGMNGVSESIYYLVPMVLLPKTVEQELNAVRDTLLSHFSLFLTHTYTHQIFVYECVYLSVCLSHTQVFSPFLTIFLHLSLFRASLSFVVCLYTFPFSLSLSIFHTITTGAYAHTWGRPQHRKAGPPLTLLHSFPLRSLPLLISLPLPLCPSPSPSPSPFPLPSLFAIPPF